MKQQRDSCSRQTIEHFFADELSEDELSTFQDHLESCPSCRAALEDMAADESWWQEARGYLTEPSPDLASNQPPVADEDGVQPLQAIQGYLSATDDPRMLGRLGGYEISGIVGSGGMGIVLKGWDAPLSRYVAIKVLAPQLASSAAARQRFAREAKAAAAVIHDNVMAIHSVAEASGLPFFVMPYVRGHSLASRLDKTGAF